MNIIAKASCLLLPLLLILGCGDEAANLIDSMTFQSEYRIRNETSGSVTYSFKWTLGDTTRYSGNIAEGGTKFIRKDNRTGFRVSLFDVAVDSLFINGDSPVRVYEEWDLFEEEKVSDEVVVYTLVLTDSLLEAHAAWAKENPVEFYTTRPPVDTTSGGGGGGGGGHGGWGD